MENDQIISDVEGLYILRVKMPYPLGDTNAYLVRTGSGWTVIDLGIDIPETRKLWEEIFRSEKIAPEDVMRIIVTHCHPDHLGAAAWMQKETGAPVLMSEKEINYAGKYVALTGDIYENHRREIRGEMYRHDFDDSKRDRVVKDWCENVIPFFPVPEKIEVLNEGDIIELNGAEYTVRIFAGHSGGQVVLWNSAERILFSGDIFSEKAYLHFADWPHSECENPLQGFLLSLDAVEKMNPALIYPGHGEPIREYKELFAKLRARHSRILDRVEESVTEPVTAGKLYSKIFNVPEEGYIQHHRIAMGETIGYLNYLVSQGRLASKEEGGRVWYFRV